MDCLCRIRQVIILVLFFHCLSVQVSSTQRQQQPEGPFGYNWPVTLSFHDTKTNSMLGEALLKRIYARIGFTENIIRAEVDTLFERLKEVLEKRLRKCERKRRRAGSVKSLNLESMYGYHNTSLPSPYSSRRSSY